MIPIFHNPNDYWQDHDPYNGMTDEERMASGCLQGAAFVVVIIVALLLCSMLSSCKSQEHIVTIETVRTDTTYITRHERDSIYMRDSIHVHEKGDTVTIERWHTRWRDRWQYDSLYISKIDSIPVPYPVEVVKDVEKSLTWWQQFRLGAGTLFIYIIALCLLWLVLVKFRIV